MYESTQISPVFVVIYWVVVIISIVSMWKVFTKAGQPGVFSIIPIFNIVIMFKIAGLNPWMILLLFIPFVNIVVAIRLYVKIAEAFGKDGGFAVGLILLGIVFFPILAFDDSIYVGA